jgi:ectoine hydroxylase-related dioxygenase (phytanoyl-CoA dioxygenase family)
MVHALVVRHPVFLEFIALAPLRAVMQRLLGHGCIVHAYNSSSVPPGDTNYARDIHVDSPRWVANYMTNAGCILALDPFTEASGAMEILADGFRSPDRPGPELFEAACARPELAPGDALLFNARSWHRAGVNQTSQWRHGVTVNVCRAFMRQQFDFPRLLEAHGAVPKDEDARQFLGWHVRMPASLEEFLLPADRRLYRSGQE